jgi:hypothetical protein
MADEFTITLSGEDGHVSVVALIETLENTITILRHLEFQMGAEDVHWEIVRASMQSPLALTVAPRVRDGGVKVQKSAARIIRAYSSGMRAIATGPVVPEYFDEEGLTAARKIATGVKGEDTQLSITVPDEEPVTITKEVADHINQVVSRSRPHYEEGTIEGTLEVVSTHKGYSVSVWEALTRNKVDCFIAPEKLEEAKALLSRRVAVLGRIKYRGTKPVSIQVTEIRRLRDRSELPQPETIGKVNITGGVSSEEYVREWRDGK